MYPIMWSLVKTFEYCNWRYWNSQQVQNKVSFPREPKVSTECRKLITKILSPLKVRVKIPQILADPWLNPNQPVKDEEVDTTQVDYVSIVK